MSAAGASAAASSSAAPHVFPIARVLASSLTPSEFISRFVVTNAPVIVEGALQAWTPPDGTEAGASTATSAEWTIARLEGLLGATQMQNVFVSAARHRRRFKYFKAGSEEASSSSPTAAAASPATEGDVEADGGLTRSSMTFGEFVARSSQAQADGGNGQAYYLYGEPMPAALQPLFPTLPILSEVTAPLTSTLLWVSPSSTISPLHYDLSEGVLAQVHGEKLVTLAAPSFYSELYPHPLRHAHDRQSRVDDIHAPNREAFPLARDVPLQQGVLGAGSLLYIPYGWWHQLESPHTSISVSQRWNPHAEDLQRLAAAWHVTAALPTPAREQICRAQLAAVPKVVALVNRRRWDEL